MNGCSTKAGQESLVSHDAFGVLIFLGVAVTLGKKLWFCERRKEVTYITSTRFGLEFETLFLVELG